MLVSCPNVKLECAEHCHHFLPHDMVRMCRDGTCPITHRRCECTNTPVVNLNKHSSISNGEFRWAGI